jgi:hypothetical protein
VVSDMHRFLRGSDDQKDKWDKIEDDEPVFILRAQDVLASEAIGAWIDDARAEGVNEQKVNDAIEHQRAFEAFRKVNPHRVKTPD